MPGFQPFVPGGKPSLGVAQGWYEAGPLALNCGVQVQGRTGGLPQEARDGIRGARFGLIPRAAPRVIGDSRGVFVEIYIGWREFPA